MPPIEWKRVCAPSGVSMVAGPPPLASELRAASTAFNIAIERRKGYSIVGDAPVARSGDTGARDYGETQVADQLPLADANGMPPSPTRP